MSRSKIGKTRVHWLGRGFVVGMMLVAAINAVSYLFRSNSIRHLFDQSAMSGGAIGFPLEVWSSNKAHGTLFINLPAFAVNVGFAICCGAVFATIAYFNISKLNRWVDDFESDFERRTESRASAQFSIKGMLIATFLVSLMIVGVTNWHGTDELLWFVYVLGPIALLGVSFIPRGFSWQARAILLSLASFVRNDNLVEAAA